MSKKPLLLGILVLAAIVSYAQLHQAGRYEVALTENQDFGEFKVLPWGSEGLVFYRRNILAETDVIQFIKLDTALHERWAQAINVSKQLNLAFAKSWGNKAYFLFRPARHYGDFQLFSLSSDSGRSQLYTIKNIIPFHPEMFEIGSKAVVVTGYYNYRPVAIHFSFETGQSKLLPGFFNEPGELNQLHMNADNSIDVVVNMRNSDRKRSLWIMSYDNQGNALKNTIIHPSKDRNLIFGRMVKTSGDSTVLAGVYGKNHEYSRGVFIATIASNGEYVLRYYNFAEFKNFFKYLRAARESRIQQRIERRKIKGKKLKFNYRMALHEFVPYQDHFLLLGEAFYPVYKSAGYSSFRGATPYNFSRSYPISNRNSDMVFDGYRYTHAVTLGIAKNGKLLWDNSFEVKNVKSFTLEQYVHSIQGKNLNLVYAFDGKLYSKIIRGKDVVAGKSEKEMDGLWADDKIRRDSQATTQVEYWYGPYLLTFGTQKIRNQKTLNVDLNRRVFYISKVTYKD